MAVMKVIEVLSESKKSYEDAISKAVVKASESIKNIKSAYVNEQSAVVKNGKVSAYRVNLKITFQVD